MVIAFVTGLIIGFLLSIPPGPIGVSIMKKALQGNKKGGYLIGLGAALMDILYVFVAFHFTAMLTRTMQQYISQHSLAFLLLQLIVVALLIGYGVLNLKIKRVRLVTSYKPQSITLTESISQRITVPFFVGVTLALANLANPTFLPSILYMVMVLHEQQLWISGFAANAFFSLGFGIGVMIWISILVELFAHLRNRLSISVLHMLHRFAGITLIGIGTYLGYRVLSVVRWTDLLRFVF